MLHPASLQVPSSGGGRSRFSKALPAIPPIDTSAPPQQLPQSQQATSISSPPAASAPTPTQRSSKPLPVARTPSDLPPPPTPPHNDDPRVPIQFTPLPALPPKKKPVATPTSASTTTPTSATPTTPSSGPSRMAIPRRPVGSKQPSQQHVKTLSAQQSSTASPRSQPLSPEKQLPAPQVSKPLAPLPPSPPEKQLPQPQSQPHVQQKEPATQTLRSAPQAQVQQAQTPVARVPIKSQAPLPQPSLSNEKELPRPQTQQKEQNEISAFGTQKEQKQEKEQPKGQEQEQKKGQELPPVPPKSASRSTDNKPSPLSTPQSQMLSPPQQQSIYFDAQYQQPLKSPSESLSSFLSAYSRSSTASIIRSSDGTAYSAVESRVSQVYDSYHYDGPPSAKDPSKQEDKESLKTVIKAPISQQPTTLGNKTDSSPPAPPPPAKDSATHRSESPARALNVGQDSAAASPPRQQIWRRRSIKGSRDLPNLNLNYSHGSTASTSTVATITASQKPPPPVKASPAAALQQAAPTDKPADVASRELAPEPPAKDKPAMGQGSSKIRQLKDKFHVSKRSNGSAKSTKSDKSGPTVNRPPTPEYRKEDVKTPVISTFVSPISPASSPEPPTKDSLDMAKSQSDQCSGTTSEMEAKPITRKAVPAAAPVSAPASAPVPTSQASKSVSDQKARTPPTGYGSIPPAATFPRSGRHSPAPSFSRSGRNSPAPDMAPRGRQPGPPGAFPPSSRNTSARPSSRGSIRPGGPGRMSGPEPEPRWVRSSSGDLCYRGRDGTLYPEMTEDLPEPDPEAMRFPIKSEELPAMGTIFKALPLKDSHFNCYQRHKTIQRRPNRRYPLACQVCEKQDTEDRFACSFCHVKMCSSCMSTFETKGRDLKALQAELSLNTGTLSLSSPTRPGSALGLEISF